ncbi:glutamate receptor 2-like [Babylonia areolata]|uniref:glutamate receptor 2-like n=1 Tax=Babylonia areolata TaxID=304850 RepID=UPI003FCFB30A
MASFSPPAVMATGALPASLMVLLLKLLLLLLMAMLLPSSQTMAAQVEVPIGLVLHEKSPRLEKAFNFATMVLNHNMLGSRPSSQRNHKLLLYSAGGNKTNLDDNYKMGATICNLFSEGVHAVVGTTHPSTYNTIQSYSHALHVPFILASTTRQGSSRDQYKYDVSMAPPFVDAVIKVIASIPLNHKVYYVYDSDDGLWRLQKLYQFFQRRPEMARAVDAFRIRDIESAYSILRGFDMKDDERKTIVLDLCSTSAYRQVLEQVIDVGMNRDEYHYILASATAMDLGMDSDFYAQFLYGGVNITAFSFVANNSDMYRMWEQQWRQYKEEFPGLFPITSDTALMLDAVRTAYEAIQATRNLPRPSGGRTSSDINCRLDKPRPSPVGDRIMENIRKVKFDGLSGPVDFIKRKRAVYNIDVYRLRFKQKMQKTETWKSTDLALDTLGVVLPTDITVNKTQKVTTVLEDPFVQEVLENKGGEPAVGGKHYEGYCIDLLKMVAERANFQYSLHVQGGYGAVVNGSWTGMVGELVRKEQDIAVAPLTITEERERVVDFTKPFMNTGISIMIKKPDRQKPGVFSFMEPLDTWVWLCIAVGFLAVSFVLFFVGRFSPYEWQVSEEGGKEPSATNTFTISNTLWFSLGALMQQGSDISPRSLSGRVIGSAWWFFTLIIISSYTANLAAFLTIEKLVSPIDSADDLVEHPTIKYGTMGKGTSWRFFAESTVPTFARMREVMENNQDEVLVSEVILGVRKVRNSKGKFAFLLESAMNNYHSQQKPCDVMRVGDNLDNKGYGIATRVNHPLKQNINIAVLELAEIGELYKLEQKWWYDKGKCGDTTASKDAAGKQSALTLSNVSGIFHILIGGLVLSMITSSIEYLVQRHLKARASRKNHVCKAPPPPPPPRRACYQPVARADYKTNYYENEPTQEKLQATTHMMTYEPDDASGDHTDI